MTAPVHRVLAGLAGLWVGVVASVLLAAAPAAAHAQLLESDPAQGAVLEALPEVVTLTFNENISAPEVRIFDAEGEQLPLSARAVDGRVEVDTSGAGPVEGTLVLVWQIASADGHEVGGSLSFSVGEPTQAGGAAVGLPPGAAAAAPPGASWVALLVGSVALGLGAVALVRASDRLAVAAVVAGAVWLPLVRLGEVGGGWPDLLDWRVWADAALGWRGLVVLGAGLLVATLASRRTRVGRWVAVPALVGLGLAAVVVPSVGEPAPAPAVVGQAPAPASVRATTPLPQGGTVQVRLEPAAVGPVRVVVRLSDGTGGPLRAYSRPSLSLATDTVDLGEVVLRRRGDGTYRGETTLPVAGEWTASVSVRLDEFTNPVVSVALPVG